MVEEREHHDPMICKLVKQQANFFWMSLSFESYNGAKRQTRYGIKYNLTKVEIPA